MNVVKIKSYEREADNDMNVGKKFGKARIISENPSAHAQADCYWNISTIFKYGNQPVVLYFFSSLSLSHPLSDLTDLIQRDGTSFETIAGRTAFIDRFPQL